MISQHTEQSERHRSIVSLHIHKTVAIIDSLICQLHFWPRSPFALSDGFQRNITFIHELAADAALWTYILEIRCRPRAILRMMMAK